MTIVYLIVGQSYAYNDEGYDLEDGVNPQFAFHDKEIAEKECKELNDKKRILYRGIFGSYGEEAPVFEPYTIMEIELK
jgi:hypothetical protein